MRRPRPARAGKAARRISAAVVFDDSIKEFLALKKRLADYFDEGSIEDIFDYIPPQKTNQIFTPKDMVKKMVIKTCIDKNIPFTTPYLSILSIA